MTSEILDKRSPRVSRSSKFTKIQEIKLAAATGLVEETPTATLPYKAVISHSGEIIHEQYFSTRAEAEIYIVETLQGLKESAGDVIAPK